MQVPENLSELSSEQRRALLATLLRQRRAAPRRFPLSSAQQRIWFLDQLDPGTAAYNIPAAVRLMGTLDLASFHAALREIVRRHGTLRSFFVVEDDQPVQVTAPELDLHLPRVDLRGLPPLVRERELRRVVRHEVLRPIDLTRGPLLRVTLFETAEKEHVVQLVLHHIVSDGWSMGVLVREIAALYEAFVRGERSPLSELPIQYTDFVAWQRKWLADGGAEEQLSYWRRHLAGELPVLDLPADRVRPARPSVRGSILPAGLPAHRVALLRRLADQEGATLFMVLLAGFATLLFRYTGQADVLVGSPVANRRHREVEGLIGIFVNTLVLRADLSGEPTFRELLRRVRETALEAYANQDVPFERLVNELRAGTGGQPLFQVMFVLQNVFLEELRLPDLTLRPYDLDVRAETFDLTLALTEGQGRLDGTLTYLQDLFERDRMERLLGHFATLLASAAENAALPISALPLLGDAERRQIEVWSRGPRASGPPPPAHRLFEAQADCTPGAVALLSGSESLTYRELEERSNRLAWHLLTLGVAEDDRVGICLERSPGMIATVLAVLKAGAAYVPLDPAYPAERLAAMVEDAGIRTVVTRSGLGALLSAGLERVAIDGVDLSHLPARRPDRRTLAGQLAYVIFTSGSTGRPKGVAMLHGALANLLAWQLRAEGFDRPVRTLQFASLSFDVSFQEIFTTLGSGGALVLVTEAVRRDPHALAALLAEREVERLFVPFVFLQQLAETAVHDGIWPSGLREVVSAGEQLRVTPAVRALAAAVPGFALHNQYGPSESHVVTACTLSGAPERWPDLPPIGEPIAGARVLVLDRRMQPVPQDVPGELFLGGPVLARGYLGRPDLTADRFVPDPTGTDPGARLYRTGDLVRFLRGGGLEFLRRIDDQVKVRGHRVELGEIEAVLARHPGVRETVVAVVETSGVRRLAAYFVPAPGRVPSPAELREHLGSHLPAYMMPSMFVRLAAMPLTPSGKVDRRALPEPEAEPEPERAARPSAPRSPAEAVLTAIWSELLGVQQVSVQNDFFGLGGDSILGIQMVSRARRAGLRITVDQLFRQPTVETLAACAEAAPPEGGARKEAAAPGPVAALDLEILDRLRALHPNLEDVYPLSPMQQGILVHAVYHARPGDYAEQFSTRIRGAFDEVAFQGAWETVFARHPALRTSFVWKDVDEPVQVVAREVKPVIKLRDLRRLPPEEQQQRIAAEVHAQQSGTPFDPGDAPLVRVALFALADDLHEFLWSSHALALDGWSGPLLLKEVHAAYEALAAGRPVELPPAPPYRAYIDWLLQQDLGDAEGFWRRELQGFTAPTPVGAARLDTRAARGSGEIRNRVLRLGPEATEALLRLARQLRVTPNALAQCAWGFLLGRYADTDDVVFGGVVSGRPADLPGVENIVGLLLNTLPVRVQIPPALAVSQWAQGLHSSQLSARAFQHAPLALIQRWSEVEPGLRLFSSILAFANYPQESGGSWEIQDRSVQKVGYPVFLLVRPSDDWVLDLTFDVDAFDPVAALRLLVHFRALLRCLGGRADQPVSELSCLEEAERAQLLTEWNDRAASVPAGLCAHEIFEGLAAATPDAVAAVCEGERLTYGELNRKANRLARSLVAAGAGQEAVVALLAPRGLPFLTAILAVFKAGAAYLPLDMKHPLPRLLQTLRSSRAGILLTAEGAAADLFDGVPAEERPRLLSIEDGEGDGADLPPSAGPENLAYVIYTSGSTGTPKGAMIVHRGMLNHLVAKVLDLDLTASDVMAQTASVTFDISVWQFLVALISGGRVSIVPDEVAHATRRLLEAVVQGGVTVLELVPSFLDLLLEELEQAGRPPLPSLRWLMTTGEALPPGLCRRWLQAYPSIPLVNAYGPTECSDDITHLLVYRSPAPDTVHMPVGRPVANTRIHLLDPSNQPVPLGAPGEICVAGEGVGRGYLRDPLRTAAVFVPSVSGVPGERMYRTGDLGSLLADGSVVFLGRIDHQVKLRGFRIELGEIEAALERHSAVHQAAVLLREDLPGRKRLVAYVTARSRQRVEAGELRQFLGETLPEPMIPSAFVILESLPLTNNGKIDRRALPVPPEVGGGVASAEGPQTPVEEILGTVWCEILQLDRVGRHDSFFDLGGHSLLANRLVSAVRRIFRVELPLRTVFEAPTLTELARQVELAASSGSGAVAPALRPVARDEALPLSFSQERLWFLDQLQPGTSSYNLPGAFRVTGRLSVDLLEKALNEVLRRHEVLRSRFLEVDGRPVQVVEEPSPVPLPLVSLEDVPEPWREAELARRLGTEAARPFDLGRGPLVRCLLLRLGEAEHALLITLHHMVADGWSNLLLAQELAALYAGSALPDLPVQYGDYAVWQRQWLTGDTVERDLAHFRERLAGAPPVLDLPLDRPRPSVQSFRGASLPVALSPELLTALRELSRRRVSTLFMTLLSGLDALLYRYTGQEHLVVGTPIANRGLVELEPLIGSFASTLILAVRATGELRFSDLLERVRETALSSYAHQDLPFETLVEAVRPQRDLSYNPLFQVLFGLHNLPRKELQFADLRLEPLPVTGISSRFDLSLDLIESPDGVRGSFEYASDLFDASTVERMQGHLETLLAGAVAAPETRLSELALLTDAERRQLQEAWVPAEPVWAECLHELVEAQARLRPEAEAVVCGHERLSYGELDRRANAVARRLREQGVGAESLVGVHVERSVEMVVALLGVLKSGGVYVPLDPGYPAQRVARILESASPSALVRGRTESELPEHGALEVWLDGGEEDEAPPAAGVTSANLAYVIYTSGSTGQPKGVQISHGSAVHLMEVARRRHGLGQGDVWTVFHSFAFDFSVWEIWGALALGGKLVIVPLETARMPERFGELLERERVTVLNQTPSAVRALSEIRQGTPSSDLRLLMCGGEAFPRELAPRLRIWGAEVWNFYGPTEATVWASAGLVGEGSEVGVVPLGSPLPGYRLYVVDAYGQALPAGVPGELGIGGVGLARGYFGDPVLTAERFVPDAFGPEPGSRLYRTGDLVRRLTDGELEYLGRIDHQVKVRGFRIELGEIESALKACPGVDQAVVVTREEGAVRRLVAFLVGEVRATSGELRAFVSERLPEYMVPSTFSWLDALPLTPNGKIDRRALPASPQSEAGPAAAEGPRSQVEEILGGIWGEILKIDRVGRQDSFFEAGGHSLLATRLVSAVRRTFHVELPLRAVFETPTLADLARRIELAASAGRATGPELRVWSRESDELPLSFAQERLWFLQQLEPQNPFYSNSAAVRLSGRQNVEALRRTLSEVVRRHEVLRTTYPTREGQPKQKIEPPAPLPLPIVDLSSLECAQQEREMEAQLRAQSRRPFDLDKGPVLRFLLLRLAQDEHVVLYSIHHIASDAWSTAIFAGEVAAIYPAFCQGQASPLPEPALQYADFAQWQRDWLRGDVLEEQLAYWRRALGGNPPVLRLPIDRPRPARPSWRGLWRTFQLPAGLCQELQRLSRQHGATLFMTLLAAFNVLLQRSSGQDDIVVGTAMANRSRSETEGLIGFFINMLPMRVDLSGNPRFIDLLRRVREIAVEALGHQEVPLEKLVEALRPEGERDGAPLFRVAFGVQNAPTGEIQVPGLTLRPVKLSQETSRFDLTVWVEEQDGRLHVIWNASAELFHEETIERLHRRFEALLHGIAAAPESRIGSLEMLTAEEREARALSERDWQEQQAGRLSSIRRRKTFSGTP